MKNIVKIVSILAVANLMGVLGVVGWLISAGRVDRQRLTEVVAILGETPANRAARIEVVSLNAQEPAEPVGLVAEDIQTTEGRNQERAETTMIQRERVARLQREVQGLQTQLRLQRQMLEEERALFEQEKTAFASMRERLTRIEGAEAFQSALDVLLGMKPEDIRPVLTNLMNEGKIDEVVTYLASFEERQRAKVITEFVQAGEVQVAAGLLESLRTRGLEPVQSGASDP